MIHTSVISYRTAMVLKLNATLVLVQYAEPLMVHQGTDVSGRSTNLMVYIAHSASSLPYSMKMPSPNVKVP